ncbi:hypothetical protein ACJBS0_10455, partial [Streptococcus suis]
RGDTRNSSHWNSGVGRSDANFFITLEGASKAGYFKLGENDVHFSPKYLPKKLDCSSFYM